jgi:hypothetical protein
LAQTTVAGVVVFVGKGVYLGVFVDNSNRK